MYGLELRALVWDAGGRHELDPAIVSIRRGGQAVVIAEAPVASTFADVVCGLTPPVSGQVLVDGRDVTGGPPAPNRIALVPLGGGLLPHLSVARNIEFNLDRSNSPEARAAYVALLARQFGIEGALDQRPHRLSAEQRLRVATARALGRRPSALVVEDRANEVSAATVAHAVAAGNIAVLVITDSVSRAGTFSSRQLTARPVHTAPAT